MKKSIRDFLKANGFYLAFGIGVVALVAALAVYNVNSRKSSEGQDINLNEPIESDLAEMDDTNDTSDVADGDLDVPMDMQNGQSSEDESDSVEAAVIPEASAVKDEQSQEEADAEAQTEEDYEAQIDVSDETVEEVLSSDVTAYAPLEGLEFLGLEEVSMPVLGNTILPYSMDTTVYFQTLGLYRCNPGILLQAPEGTEVVSIWHGQVTAIEDTKEYGTTVTVNLGSGYEMTYGQLQDIRVSVGDEVFQDTILGTVAAPTAYYQEEGDHVYFAMTKDGTPVDPMDVLQLE